MKRKTAAALKYSKKYNTPIVTAIGFGQIAEKIVEKANNNNVPVMEDPDLAESLSKIPLGDSIPPELYEAVAQVIAYIYRMNDSMDL